MFLQFYFLGFGAIPSQKKLIIQKIEVLKRSIQKNNAHETEEHLKGLIEHLGSLLQLYRAKEKPKAYQDLIDSYYKEFSALYKANRFKELIKPLELLEYRLKRLK